MKAFLSLVCLAFLFAPSVRAAEMRDLLRTYSPRDFAECLDEFRDREFFEAMYRQAHTDATAENHFIVGVMYHHGIGVPANQDKAAFWYESARSLGYAFTPFLGDEASKALRRLATEKRPPARDIPEAWFDEILAAGGAGQILRVALQYQYGLCAPMDYVKAREWEVRAAETGDYEAVSIVEESFRFGYNAYPADSAEADAWLEKKNAMTRPPPDVLDITKKLLATETQPQSLEEYARQIHEEGKAHFYGELRPVDYYQAGLRFAEAAAFSVDIPDNYFLLGKIQEEGLCGMPNPYGAGKHYRIAAEMGHREACFRLGMLHEKGEGVRQSLAQAETLYSLAGDTPDAPERLRLVKAEMVPGRKEEWEESPVFREVVKEAQFRAAFKYTVFKLPDEMRRAYSWLIRSADNGFPPAQCQAGLLYLRGDPDNGFPKDAAKAREWLRKAADAGMEEAEKALARLNPK